MSNSGPHVALLPGSGMGHLVPITRLATAFLSLGCRVTLVIPLPLVSDAESSHISLLHSTYPDLRLIELHLLPVDTATLSSSNPFFLRAESVRLSAHLLPELLSPLPTLSALITDVFIASAFVPATAAFRIPSYVLFTSSASMLAFAACFPRAQADICPDRNFLIPSLPPIPPTSIPSLLFDPANLFTTQFTDNGRSLLNFSGILINTFHDLEPDHLAAMNAGKVIEGLPEVIPMGPLEPHDFKDSHHVPWLDDQPDGSVVFLNFGNRTVLSPEQIEEVKKGLEMSGVRFLWVVKTKMVDKEEEGGSDSGQEVMGRGLAVRKWVEQGWVLKHRAVGGFVSHCGWNSVTEAAWEGVPVLAWPQHGDQMINAAVVEGSGLGRWEKGWGRGGEVVKGEEIAERVRGFMEDEELKGGARRVKETARRAAGAGGRSRLGLVGLMEKWTAECNRA